MPTITFLPSGVTIEVKPGTTVFSAAARAEVPIASQCGGKCACALCRVEIVDGADVVAPMRWEEEAHMGNVFFITKQRLSCQLQVFGDVTIRVTEPEVREKPRGRYVPHALLRKREELERAADRDDAVGRRRPGSPRPEGPPRGGAPAKPRPKNRPTRRRKGRNPGAPRSGDSRAPAGAKKKKI